MDAGKWTPGGPRACGICGARDIPYGVDWPWWSDGKPVHPACQATLGMIIIDEATEMTPEIWKLASRRLTAPDHPATNFFEAIHDEMIWREGTSAEKVEMLHRNLLRIVKERNDYARLLIAGWSVGRVSLYDEEGIEGWRWTSADAQTEYTVTGHWEDVPTIPDELA